MRAALLTWFAVRVGLVAALLLLPGFEPWTGTESAPLRWRDNASGEAVLYDDHRLVDAWLRHDSAYYLQIAILGYGVPTATSGVKEGFFPLYPALIQVTAQSAGALRDESGLPVRCYAPAAVGLSQVLGLVAVMLMVLLVSEVAGRPAGRRAGIALAVHPFGFLLGAGLTEALFLVLALGSFLAIRRDAAFAGAITGGLAAATRIFGVVLALPLALAAWRRRARSPRAWIGELFCLAIVPVGLLAALSAIGSETGDLGTYFRLQAGHGHAAFPTLQGVFDLFDLEGLTGWSRALSLLQIATLLVCLLLLVGQVAQTLRGVLPPGWLLYTLPMMALPLLAGSIISLPRYATVLFPLVAVVAILGPRGRAGLAVALLSAGAQITLFLAFAAHAPLVI